MKILLKIVIFIVLGILYVHADQYPHSNAELPELARKTAVEWTWGAATNGVVGGIHVGRELHQHQLEIRIFAHEEFHVSADSLPPTFYSEPNTNAISQDWFFKIPYGTNQAGCYFKATNYFCGPVALRNSDGVVVSSLNRNLTSIASYPKSFRHRELGVLDAFHGKMAWPLVGRLPELAKFKLDEIFEMKKPGDYVLTVWPKIYRQLKNDDDLCERIDLPPISVKINWTVPPETEKGQN
jgi:hypothetical protein